MYSPGIVEPSFFYEIVSSVAEMKLELQTLAAAATQTNDIARAPSLAIEKV